jgi:hypothetical protein
VDASKKNLDMRWWRGPNGGKIETRVFRDDR